MRKLLLRISLFVLCVFGLFYWMVRHKEEMYHAKWNDSDTVLAVTIDGEISTSFPTTSSYSASVSCSNGSGKASWNGSKWVLSTSGFTKGSVKCNIDFVTKKPSLSDKVLADNQVKDPITTPGSAVSSATEAVLASAEDDYGTSYYFRGNVKNNYVEFKEKCWRVVRITGDGSAKLILHNDNINNNSNPCTASTNDNNAGYAHLNGEMHPLE